MLGGIGCCNGPLCGPCMNGLLRIGLICRQRRKALASRVVVRPMCEHRQQLVPILEHGCPLVFFRSRLQLCCEVLCVSRTAVEDVFGVEHRQRPQWCSAMLGASLAYFKTLCAFQLANYRHIALFVQVCANKLNAWRRAFAAVEWRSSHPQQLTCINDV